MSYTQRLRKELSRRPEKKRCCQEAELHALFLALGQYTPLGGGHLGFGVATGDQAVFSRILALSKETFGFAPAIHKLTLSQPRRSVRYVLEYDKAMSAQIMAFFNLLSGLAPEPASDCCEAAFVRGLFLACGLLSNPEKEYLLEFVFAGEDLARTCLSVCARLHVNLSLYARKNSYIAAVKEYQQLTTLVALMGGHTTLLEIESIQVTKDVRGRINRSMNCENANMDKLARASALQLEGIELLRASGALESLSPPLQEAAEARLSNPQAPLSELAGLLGISKSGAAGRFKALLQAADGIRLSGK